MWGEEIVAKLKIIFNQEKSSLFFCVEDAFPCLCLYRNDNLARGINSCSAGLFLWIMDW